MTKIINKKLSAKSKKTIEKLIAKSEIGTKRFPSINELHLLFTEVGIKHSFDGEVTNIVEYRSGGNRYVNDRHNGKVGKKIYKIEIPKELDIYLRLDSSDSYFSWNTFRYTLDLLKLLEHYKLVKN